MEDVRLIHGDCLDCMGEIPAGSVDCVATSPPYAMQRAKQYGGVPEADYPGWTVRWMREVRRVLHPLGSVLLNIREHVRGGQISDYVHRTRLAVRADGWLEPDELIWDKKSGPPCGRVNRPRRSWERVLWFALSPDCRCYPRANGSAPISPRGGIFYAAAQRGAIQQGGAGPLTRGEQAGDSRCTDVARFSVRTVRSSQHSAAFPVPLAEWMLRLVTLDGMTVLDPFVGSGTTLIACLNAGRRGIGIEKFADIYATARRRVDAALAARAELLIPV